jgi:hypothetical protein
MKLIVYFGAGASGQQVYWDKSLTDFPKTLSYDGQVWEWAMYENGEAGIDYILHFSLITGYDPRLLGYDADFRDIMWVLEDKCVCGAKHTSFSQIHMFYCPKWSK